MATSWLEPGAEVGGQPIIGNARTTFAKGQVNMNLNYKIRQPIGTSWRTMTMDQFMPSQRLYLLTFFRGNTDLPDDNPCRVDWDALYSCYNAS